MQLSNIQNTPNMKKIRYLQVSFDGKLRGPEIPAFRGAIVERVGREYDLFHNHNNQSGGYLHRYPLIQYKSLFGHAGLVCLNEGVDAIQEFFSGKPDYMAIADRELEMGIRDLKTRQITIRTWNKRFYYKIRSWIPLSGESYREYRNEICLQKRMAILSRILNNHLVSLAYGLGWFQPDPIESCMTNLDNEFSIRLKGIGYKAFDITFCTNIYLPDFIGLGKWASMGLGTIRQINFERP